MVIPVAASAGLGPAASSVSASRDIATVAGRVRRVGTNSPARTYHSSMVTGSGRRVPEDAAADGRGGRTVGGGVGSAVTVGTGAG